MKKIVFVFVLILGLISCSSEDEIPKSGYVFIKKYTTKVVVGGVVGIYDRTFEIGEVYEGKDEGKETIEIRIAEYTEINNDCPNNRCYQEFIEVPREFLKYQK